MAALQHRVQHVNEAPIQTRRFPHPAHHVRRERINPIQVRPLVLHASSVQLRQITEEPQFVLHAQLADMPQNAVPPHAHPVRKIPMPHHQELNHVLLAVQANPQISVQARV